MAEYSAATPLTYRQPTTDQVPLTPALAKTIFSFQKTRRESLHHLCLIAYGLRSANLKKIKTGQRGGNAQGQILNDTFNVWYKKNQMKDVYGSGSNFTTYAMAGRLLQYTRWQIDAKEGSNLIEKLPKSLGAMYELSKILWTQGGKTITAGKEEYRRLLKEPTADGSHRPTFINPELKRSEVIQKLRSPQGGRKESLDASDIPEEVPSDSFVLASITIDSKCFSFSANGKSKGASVEQVRAFSKELEVLIRRHAKYFQVSSNLNAVISKIEESARPDFGKNLQ